MQFTDKTIGVILTMMGIMMIGPTCLGLTMLGGMTLMVNEFQPGDPVFTEMMGSFGLFFIIFGSAWTLFGCAYLGFGIMIFRESLRPFDWLRQLAWGMYGFAVIAMIGFMVLASHPIRNLLFVIDLVTAVFIGGFITIFATVPVFILNRRVIEDQLE